MIAARTAHTLDAIAHKAVARSDTSDVRFAVRAPGLEWSYLADGAPHPYFVASITKLATTAVVFQHLSEGLYDLDTPASALLPETASDRVAGLSGSGAVASVEDLLAHTSGIPDYFETAPRGHQTMLAQIRAQDVAWSPHEAIDMIRGRAATATPGDRRRARYSDTNFQLLQLIIESHDGNYAQAVHNRICKPLGLSQTYIFSPHDVPHFHGIAAIKDGSDEFARPQAMASFQADGGMVSTTAEQIRFLQAYMDGELFPQQLLLRATQEWRRLFFPLEYSLGTMRFRLPRAMAPFSPMPPFIGHSGASGAVLFHDPSRDLTIAGSVNQLRKRSLAFQVLGQMERALR
ncbi:serine hydrolase domain-containing protein [Demequina sediminicola]|uniref:serine hydrolase domain-containing protein n=1 Tax=Demequina sediminicola TaxID=1095026 RepID=UPI001379187B|nr:serine hydrolase domain-containing protein [Demequina sediminicola]